MFRMNTRRFLTLGLFTLALGACDDLLTVSDPQRYTASDLDEALPAVANGVEGSVHQVYDTYIVYQELLADVYQHTGTWSGFDEVDHGRFQYGTSPMDGTHNSWLRARWFARDAAERFTRVLEGAAATDPKMAQVHLSEALTNLYIGLAVCESPIENSGASQASAQVLTQAVADFDRAMATASASGTSSTYGNAAMAGKATALWALGDIAAAAGAAASVPAGYSYDAIMNQQSTNYFVVVTTKGNNEAAGLMYKYWDRIDQTGTPSSGGAPSSMRDPWTNEYDTRIGVWFDGEIATDNETPHYSQYKFTSQFQDIPMLHSDGMKLIVAENQGFAGGGIATLNALRAAGGLSAVTPADAAEFEELLINERFAEHFMEGMRMNDLRHFGISADVFNALDQDGMDYDGDGAPGDSDRVAAGRPIQFSLSDTEALYNDNIENDLSQRCFPKN